jgi:hypothetical protein
MEGLKQRIYVLSAAFAAFGLWVQLSPVSAYEKKTEKQMEQLAPARVGPYTYRHSVENPEQSYRMEPGTYSQLAPYGIVCRTYSYGGKSFDVVLIASGNRGSFHDPRVCFSSQGLAPTDHVDVVRSKRGDIPVTVASLDNGTTHDNLALYFYRGPGGFFSNVVGLKWAMFKERFFGGRDVDGVFYRIIPTFPGTKLEDVKQFAADYVVASEASSKGYF